MKKRIYRAAEETYSSNLSQSTLCLFIKMNGNPIIMKQLEKIDFTKEHSKNEPNNCSWKKKIIRKDNKIISLVQFDNRSM